MQPIEDVHKKNSFAARIFLYGLFLLLLLCLIYGYVQWKLREHTVECAANPEIVNSKLSALKDAQTLEACLNQKNGFLENLFMRPLHDMLHSLPNNPAEYAGTWHSSRPECEYQITLHPNGDFNAEPIKCNISSENFTGYWGVHENSMVWISKQGRFWPPDINPIEPVNSNQFILKEENGTRTRFSRVEAVASVMPAVEAASMPAATPSDANPVSASIPLTLNRPAGMVSDGKNLFVTDSQNNAIYRIESATGEITALAGSGSKGARNGMGSIASFDYPMGIALDAGNLYVADTNNNSIRRIIIATGEVTTLAGSGMLGSTNGNGVMASFNTPMGISTHGGNLYVADSDNHLIRRIVIASGEVSTFAGSGKQGAADGISIEAAFNSPRSLVSDGTYLYVADSGNHKIRRIEMSTGIVTTLAGSGKAGNLDGIGVIASFSRPQGLTLDNGNLYVSDTNNKTIRRIALATGEVTTLAGSGSAGYKDATGRFALFNYPLGIAVPESGYQSKELYVADSLNGKIRQISLSSKAVTTLVVSGDQPVAVESGVSDTFTAPFGLTTDRNRLFVTDTGSSKIIQVGLSGRVTGLEGVPDGTLYRPYGIATDSNNLYIADTYHYILRKLDLATGTLSTLAGSGQDGFKDGSGTAATLGLIFGLTTDGRHLYVVEADNNTLRKISISTGVVTTLAGTSGVTGSVDAVGAAASFNGPLGITTDGINLYVADSKNNKIRKVVIASGVVTTLAGSGSQGSSDGMGTTATFYFPKGITTDGKNLYVSDSGNHKIRKIDLTTGVVSTQAGSGNAGYLDGGANNSAFREPSGITTDGRYLYLAELGNNKIRKISLASGEVTTLAGFASSQVIDENSTEIPRKKMKAKKAKRAQE